MDPCGQSGSCSDHKTAITGYVAGSFVSCVLWCRGGEVTSLAYHPSINMAATTSSSGDFKVWVQQHQHKQGNKAHWMCQSVGSFRGMPDNQDEGHFRAFAVGRELFLLCLSVLRTISTALGPPILCMFWTAPGELHVWIAGSRLLHLAFRHQR